MSAETDLHSSVLTNAKAGGAVGLANAASNTSVDYRSLATVHQNANLLVGGDASIGADTQADMTSYAYASGLGVGGDGESHNTIDFTRSVTEAEVEQGASLTADTVTLEATTSKLKLLADGAAYGAGFYSEGSDNSSVDIQAENNVTLAPMPRSPG